MDSGKRSNRVAPKIFIVSAKDIAVQKYISRIIYELQKKYLEAHLAANKAVLWAAILEFITET